LLPRQQGGGCLLAVLLPALHYQRLLHLRCPLFLFPMLNL
jgi:hypothetical protein